MWAVAWARPNLFPAPTGWLIICIDMELRSPWPQTLLGQSLRRNYPIIKVCKAQALSLFIGCITVSCEQISQQFKGYLNGDSFLSRSLFFAYSFFHISGWKESFSVVIGGDEVKAVKPSPDMWVRKAILVCRSELLLYMYMPLYLHSFPLHHTNEGCSSFAFVWGCSGFGNRRWTGP